MVEKSPFYELSQKHKAEIEYMPFIRVVGVSLKEFRSQRVEILAHTAVIFTSRTTVDSFFHICEEARITVPETMKYICQTEAVALYLQKYIVYRKRKISFADGSFTNFIELIIKHKEEKFMLALSEPHKPELPETLAKLKLQFSPVILARTVAADLNELDIKKFDLLALYSPSDVKAILERFPAEELPAVATFGEGTLRAAVDAGIKVKAMAPTPTVPSMAKAVDIYLTKLAKGEQIEDVGARLRRRRNNGTAPCDHHRFKVRFRRIPSGKQEADDAISVAISPTPTENGIKTAYSYLFQL